MPICGHSRRVVISAYLKDVLKPLIQYFINSLCNATNFHRAVKSLSDFTFIVRYSAYNHKRATAAKCRESHHRYRGTAQQCRGVVASVLRWCDSRYFAAVARLWLYVLYFVKDNACTVYKCSAGFMFTFSKRPLLWSNGQSSWLQIQRP
jgi:hypothetical protein